MYGGRASDKFITSDSEDLLQNLESSKGSVMADRGFLISGILNDMGVKLHMPSLTYSHLWTDPNQKLECIMMLII
jgi:hypothetical protein